MAKIVCVDGSVINYGGDEFPDLEVREYSEDVLRRVSNRLARSTEDFAGTTDNPSASPYDLMECMEIMRDFVCEYTLYSFANYFDSHVSSYCSNGRYTVTNRYVNWTTKGKYIYVYATRRNSPMLMKIDAYTGEIIHHAPVDERWNKLFAFSRQPVFCVETGETDPDKLVWTSGALIMPILDRGQYISRDFLAGYNIYECPDCGRLLLNGYNTRRVYDYALGEDVDMCECHSHEWFFCDWHRRYEMHTEIHRVEGNWYCDDAYSQLSITTCPRCGAEILSNNLRTFTDYDGTSTEVCRDCYASLMRGRIDWDNVTGRLNYSTKPRPVFFDKDGHSLMCREPLSFGIEDELDQAHMDDPDSYYADEAAREIMQKYRGEFYCKYDGSLEGGSEQVSMPHSIEAFEAFDWDGMFEIARDNNLAPNSTCGMHVHINRGGLGDTHTEQKRTAAKIAMVMDMKRDFFFDLSLRENRYDFDHWAGSSALHNSWEYYLSRPCYAYDRLDNAGYRYRAVNFTNSNTLEIRIFAATDERIIALANINVVYALVRLCKKTSMANLYNMSNEDLCAALIKYAHNKDAVKELLDRANLL